MCISGPERKRGTKWALVGLQPNVREVPDQVQTAHRHLRGRDPVRIRSPIPNPTTAARGERRKGAAARSMASTAGYLARRAAQMERVRLLYRRALKDTLNWAVHRHLFYQDVSSPISPLRLPLDLGFPPRSRADLTSCFLSPAGVGSPGQVRGQPTRGKASSC